MWILNQDKTVIVNANKALTITVKPVYGRDGSRPGICAIFPDEPTEVLGTYTTNDEAKAELFRLFENFDGEYHIMRGAENND